MIRVERALLSVADKRGLGELARGLRELGVEIWASGGTARHLREQGLDVRDLEAITGFGELLGGRVKTLHPHVHAAILARRDDPRQREELRARGIEPFDLVVVNLYPFERRVSPETSPEEAMEWIDIGGEALLRAAAKNHLHVGVVVDPDDYSRVLGELRGQGGLRERLARELAQKAFEQVARYNAQIARWFASRSPEGGLGLPSTLVMAEPRQLVLRYGENPHQQGALYGPTAPEQLQGKALSYVNLLDADAAWGCAREFARPTAVIVKHATPCGVASAETLAEAFERALAADEKSAFGGILGLNAPLDGETARLLVKPFFEVVVAPEITGEAREILARKKNLRVLKAPRGAAGAGWEVRTTAFGVVAQTSSDRSLTERDLEVVTERAPTDSERRDLLFAWRVVKWAKSNAIVLAKEEQTVGIGAGQVSRVDAVEWAVHKAGSRASGSVLASDAFFPFRDGVDLAAQAGVQALIQPGGSVRDAEVLEAANEHGLAMVFTRLREFRH